MTISNMPNYYGTAQLLHGANYLTSQHKCIGCLGCVGCLGADNSNTNTNQSDELIDKNVDKSGYYIALFAKISIASFMGFAMYRISNIHSKNT